MDVEEERKGSPLMEFLCVLVEFLKRGKMVKFRERKLENGYGGKWKRREGKSGF